jgi:hypothetical protein
MISRILIAAVFLASLVVANGALADWKGYPGVMCQPSLTSYEYQRTTNGRMSNISSQTQMWQCPGVRDKGGSLRGVVHVIDKTPVGNVSCQFYSRGRDGKFLGFSYRSTGRSTWSSIPQKLDFSSKIAGTSNGNAYYACFIPGSY